MRRLAEITPASDMQHGQVFNHMCLSDHSVRRYASGTQRSNCKIKMEWIECETSKATIRRGLIALLASCNFALVKAQGVATSATAAWSSQIVAFWGAVGIGVRSSTSNEASNVLTSSIATITVITRTKAIVTSLTRSEWYILAPGYLGGPTRVDVVLLSWKTKQELHSLATRMAMIAETFGRSRWLILVVGRKLKAATSGNLSGIFWTQSPRCPEFSVVRFNGNRGNFVAFSPPDLEAFVNLHQARANVTIDDIATFIARRCNWTAARVASRDEAPDKVQQSSTIGRYVTSFQLDGVVSPYVSIEMKVGQYARSRQGFVKCARMMYIMVHLTVAVAVGLMGAASGRALAVWLFSVRIIISKLGAEVIAGDDILLTLFGLEGLLYHFESAPGSVTLPGDATLKATPRWQLAVALALNVIELLLVGGGWLYGALKVEKLPPRGLVGHGMLWLAVVVAVGLSIRTIYGIRARVGARLIGIWKEQGYTRLLIAHDCKLVINSSSANSVSTSLPSPTASNQGASAYLQLIAQILSQVEDDEIAIKVALALMRQPTFCSDVQDYATKEVLKYSYTSDAITGMGVRNMIVTTASVYPWVQVLVCVTLTVLCAIFAAVYTYTDMPQYSKLVAEVVLAGNAMWFATLDRMSRLPHNPSSYTCHMIATMVASAVWYVGVKDLG